MSSGIKILVTCLLLCSVSCSRDQRIPEDVIGMVQMGNILLDMQMASAYNGSSAPPDTARQPPNRNARIKIFYQQVLMLHHTDRQEFLKSYHFYEDHPDLMKKIYDMMEDTMGVKIAFQDSLSARDHRLMMQGIPPHRVRNFMMLYRTMADSIPVTPYRIFRPDGETPAPVTTPPGAFLWLYKSVADSIHHEPRRVFNPDLFN